MIKFKRGYKYQLATEYTIDTSIKPESEVNTAFIALSTDGKLTIRSGYAWDGASFPALDTRNFMRGSLVHDAFYELMRYKLIDAQSCKAKADTVLKKLCIEDGMSRLRAWWVHLGVDWFGGKATRRKRRVLLSPHRE